MSQGEATRRGYYLAHREERRAYQKAYYESHRFEAQAYYIAHRDNIKDHYNDKVETRRDYQRQYESRHPDQKKAYRQLHPKMVTEYHKKYKQSHRKSVNASKIIQVRRGRGLIVPPLSCLNCGAEKRALHGHHPDYSKPLEVVWLCHICHMFLHRKSSERNRLTTATQNIILSDERTKR
jgi:hypothetical protein